MLGLVVLFIIGIYLLLCLGVISFAARWAKSNGRRPWVWRLIAAFVMYNLVFWDLIPTVLVHKYYCATSAGFWSYKTPEQWLQENPGIEKALHNFPNIEQVTMDSGWQVIKINPRLQSERLRTDEFAHAIARNEAVYRDVKDGQVLLRQIEYALGSNRASFHSGGSLEAWRRTFAFGWLGRGYCDYTREDSSNDQFKSMAHIYYQLGDSK